MCSSAHEGCRRTCFFVHESKNDLWLGGLPNTYPTHQHKQTHSKVGGHSLNAAVVQGSVFNSCRCGRGGRVLGLCEILCVSCVSWIRHARRLVGGLESFGVLPGGTDTTYLVTIATHNPLHTQPSSAGVQKTTRPEEESPNIFALFICLDMDHVFAEMSTRPQQRLLEADAAVALPDKVISSPCSRGTHNTVRLPRIELCAVRCVTCARASVVV